MKHFGEYASLVSSYDDEITNTRRIHIRPIVR